MGWPEPHCAWLPSLCCPVCGPPSQHAAHSPERSPPAFLSPRFPAAEAPELQCGTSWEPPPARSPAANCRAFVLMSHALMGVIIPMVMLVRLAPTIASWRLRSWHQERDPIGPRGASLCGRCSAALHTAELALWRLFGGCPAALALEDRLAHAPASTATRWCLGGLLLYAIQLATAD